MKEGNLEKAAELQREAQTFARMVLKYGAAPPIKAALKMMGIDAGKSRMPLDTGGTLTPEIKDEIRIELEKLGVLEKKVHDPLQREINIVEVLEHQGVILGHSANLLTGKASNEIVSVSIAAGPKNGSIGKAFVKMLTMPKVGHEALTVILEPNLAVKPSSLMFPTRKIKSMRQASLFYGPVQSGAAKAIASLLEHDKIPKKSLTQDVIIMAIDINLDSRNRREVTSATQEVVGQALKEIWR